VGARIGRVHEFGHQCGLGAWESSARVNSRRESDFLPFGIPLLVGIPVGLYFLLRADAVPWYGNVAFILMGVVFWCIGVSATMAGIHNYRRGHWLIHLFTNGIVMERTRAGLRAGRYVDLRAQLLSYVEPGDSTGSDVEHLMLRLTFPDGATYAMAEPLYADPDVLRTIAARCGAATVTPISHRDAVRTLAEYEWGRTDSVNP
jgi:hypothetical protein